MLLTGRGKWALMIGKTAVACCHDIEEMWGVTLEEDVLRCFHVRITSTTLLRNPFCIQKVATFCRGGMEGHWCGVPTENPDEAANLRGKDSCREKPPQLVHRSPQWWRGRVNHSGPEFADFADVLLWNTPNENVKPPNFPSLSKATDKSMPYAPDNNSSPHSKDMDIAGALAFKVQNKLLSEISGLVFQPIGSRRESRAETMQHFQPFRPSSHAQAVQTHSSNPNSFDPDVGD
ncbi:hypothetical protein BDP27DRAFT_1357237 [Rhodocollybia butyracea]|uniref:Uncharacterized protein n=1 Tax=Rhodocollybia butyracea TaxID=206335 RepID=A0A9P5UG15_9AGAR|nr:hypothetical protein BDP27DRAFT_1357237 [Rhodocollybia butyracea]